MGKVNWKTNIVLFYPSGSTEETYVFYSTNSHSLKKFLSPLLEVFNFKEKLKEKSFFRTENVGD